MDELIEFIRGNPDSRELKRALAVQMVLRGYDYSAIQDVLQISAGFISKWKQAFEAKGLPGLALGYHGSVGYLEPQQRQAVFEWLKEQSSCRLPELQEHIDQTYGVVFASNQSYYQIFADAGMSWKKSQKYNPKADPDLVAKKNSKSWLG
jgi:putative transposase